MPERVAPGSGIFGRNRGSQRRGSCVCFFTLTVWLVRVCMPWRMRADMRTGDSLSLGLSSHTQDPTPQNRAHISLNPTNTNTQGNITVIIAIYR